MSRETVNDSGARFAPLELCAASCRFGSVSVPKDVAAPFSLLLICCGCSASPLHCEMEDGITLRLHPARFESIGFL